MKQIGDEYYKLTEASQNGHTPDADQLIPLSPMRIFPTQKSNEGVNGPTVTIQKEESGLDASSPEIETFGSNQNALSIRTVA